METIVTDKNINSINSDNVEMKRTRVKWLMSFTVVSSSFITEVKTYHSNLIK